jgi:hypothetical protein
VRNLTGRSLMLMVALVLGATALQAQSSLTGDSVSLTWNFPNISTVYETPSPAAVVVGSVTPSWTPAALGANFPFNTAMQVNVAATTITFVGENNYGGTNDPFDTGSGVSFNGYVISDQSEHIVSVTIDSASGAWSGFSSSRISTDTGHIFVDFQGLASGPNNELVLHVTSEPWCDASYTGMFKGNLNVSTGQVCIVNGTITGNVQQNGGKLTMMQSKVGGNVQVSGSTFTIGNSSIQGNLQIQNTSGTTQNQVCGTTVHNDLQFQNNGAAVLIGATSCLGNTIGGNLTIQSNTATISAVGNTVGNNLTVQSNADNTIVKGNSVFGSLVCQQNSSITGSGNISPSKQGQCVGF